MSAQADEPPMLNPPAGQLREWVQLGLLLADMVARHRERLGREAWSLERAAERTLDRAARERNLRPASDAERAAHRAAGRWLVAGRPADQPTARITTAISQVEDRWVLHAIGHRPPPVGDAHAWLSCPTREHAERIAQALLNRDDPDRVERLRDELDTIRERDTTPHHRDHTGQRDRTARTDGADQDQRGGDREQQARAAASTMETELRAVFDRRSADAVCADSRWLSVMREMLDAQAEGHDIATMLQAARQRLPRALSDRTHYRSPAAYLFALLRKERDRANAGDYIDVPAAPSRSSRATRSTPRSSENPSAGPASCAGTSAESSVGSSPGPGRRGRDRPSPARDAGENQSARVAAGVLEWVGGLDSEDDLDRMLAEDTVGRFGLQVDRAIGEKFPGLLSPHHPPGPTGVPGLRSPVPHADSRHRPPRPAGTDGQQPGGGEAPDRGGPDPHRVAAARADDLEAAGDDDAPAARASVTTTPSHAARARAAPSPDTPDAAPTSQQRTRSASDRARHPDARGPEAPDPRPPRR